MTRSKNQYLLTVVDEFSRFPFAFLPCNITSSSVIKCLSTRSLSSEPLVPFTPTGAHSSSHRNSKTSAAKMELRPRKLRPTTLKAMAKTTATTELCGRPLNACYTPQIAHSVTGNVSYHQRSHRFGTLSIRSPRRVPIIASHVSNAASRWSVSPVAHLGSKQSLPRTSGNL